MISSRDLKARLRGVSGSDEQFTACCPAHEDENASLSVKHTPERWLLKCHAGCSFDDTCAALGLEAADLTAASSDHFDLAELAAQKGFTADFLAGLKLEAQRSGILVPYFERVGTPARPQGRYADGKQVWWKPKSAPIRPYGLWLLGRMIEANGPYVVFVEGCSDCWTLWKHGFNALGIPGVEMCGKLLAEHLEGIERVFIVKEDGRGGDIFVEKLPARLRKIGFTGDVRVVPMDGHDDPNRLYLEDRAAFKATFQVMLDKAQPAQARKKPATSEDSGDEKDGKGTQLEALLDLALPCRFFLGTDGEAYVEAIAGGAVWPIKGSGFRQWLRSEFYSAAVAKDSKVLAPNKEALEAALNTLEARAHFEPDIPGRVRVFLRSGATYDERGRISAIYVDLADDAGRYIEITQGGFQVVNAAPVSLLRTQNQHALPEPNPSGTLADLLPFLRTESDDETVFVLSWLLFAWHPDGPFPALALFGSAGSGKTTMAKLLRRCVDPVDTPVRRPPKTSEDLFVHARHNRVVALENISAISDRLSDDLCSIATGAGHGSRTLYTNTEETSFTVKRPILVNGIDEYITRGDLASRSLKVNVPPMSGKERSTETTLAAAFNEAHPRILGGLCHALSLALRHQDERPERLPRMADFAAFVDGASAGMPAGMPSLIEAMTDLHDRMARERAAASGLATAFEAVLKRQTNHRLEGDLSTWQKELKADRASGTDWPSSPQAFRSALRREMPVLNHLGITIRPTGRKDPQTRRALHEAIWTPDEDASGQPPLHWGKDPSHPSDPSSSGESVLNGAETQKMAPKDPRRIAGRGDGSFGHPSVDPSHSESAYMAQNAGFSESPKDAKDPKDSIPTEGGRPLHPVFAPGVRVQTSRGPGTVDAYHPGQKVRVAVDAYRGTRKPVRAFDAADLRPLATA